jgi:ketosteroid isomerase-like protein
VEGDMNDIEQIIASEERLAKAHLTLDLNEIDLLLHKDYRIIQPNGVIEDKDEVLNSYQSGNRKWETAAVNQLSVELFGNMARVIGTWSASGINNGKAFDYQARFISIWLKENNGWKNLVYSSSEFHS